MTIRFACLCSQGRFPVLISGGSIQFWRWQATYWEVHWQPQTHWDTGTAHTGSGSVGAITMHSYLKLMLLFGQSEHNQLINIYLYMTSWDIDTGQLNSSVHVESPHMRWWWFPRPWLLSHTSNKLQCDESGVKPLFCVLHVIKWGVA